MKRRLARHEPEPLVAVTLHLGADLYRLLTTLAAGEQLSLEVYLVNALQRYAEYTPVDGGE